MSKRSEKLEIKKRLLADNFIEVGDNVFFDKSDDGVGVVESVKHGVLTIRWHDDNYNYHRGQLKIGGSVKAYRIHESPFWVTKDKHDKFYDEFRKKHPPNPTIHANVYG